MGVEQGKDELNADQKAAIDQIEISRLIRRHDGIRAFTIPAGKQGYDEISHEFKRIDENQDLKQEHGIEENRIAVLQIIPPEKDVVRVPDPPNQRKAGRKRQGITPECG